MAGLDLSAVSSNWKKLHNKLKAEKKPESQGNGLKRKRIEERQRSVAAPKRLKTTIATPVRPERKGRMGLGQSQAEPAQDNKSKLVKDHGISANDVAAAYGTTQDGIKRNDDEINRGRHSTHKAGRYVALDCEMVGTGPPPHTDNVLARVSLVNFHGEQIYDSYVLPPPGIEVKDYRTFVSGIRPSHLIRGYARPFAEVQKHVVDLLQDRVLVGHALSNDLRVLLLSHPKRDLRDTSRHPKFREQSMGRPPALRDLVRRELGLKIQGGEHSSVEDARAAMMLYKKEKVGFEEDNRKRFGARRPPAKNDGKAVTALAVANVSAGYGGEAEEDDDEDEDVGLLDGEDEGLEDEGAGEQKLGPHKAGKKRKKKKRTKRH